MGEACWELGLLGIEDPNTATATVRTLRTAKVPAIFGGGQIGVADASHDPIAGLSAYFCSAGGGLVERERLRREAWIFALPDSPGIDQRWNPVELRVFRHVVDGAAK